MFYPSMPLLVREKSNYWRQIPFVAVSSWVYVQAGNSNINWLVTPANFSLAVPGVSSGGGESFDPASDYNISGKSPVVPNPTAQNQAANKNYVDANIIQVKSMLETTMRYVEKTEAEYNALSEKANNCIYYLTDKSMWAIGYKELVTSDMPA